MNEWVYSQAERCPACGQRAIVPNREIADRFVGKSEGKLTAMECPVGNGFHLVYPAVEVARPR